MGLKALGPNSTSLIALEVGELEASSLMGFGGVEMVVFLALIHGFSFAWYIAGSEQPELGVYKANLEGLQLTLPE